MTVDNTRHVHSAVSIWFWKGWHHSEPTACVKEGEIQPIVHAK